MTSSAPLPGSSQPVICLDLDHLPSTPDGENVASSIRKALTALRDIIPPDECRKLDHQAEIAATNASPTSTKSKKAHPLHVLRATAPIYSSLSTHIINHLVLRKARPLIAIAQQAALLSYLGYGSPSSAEQIAIANFAHQIGNSDISTCIDLSANLPSSLTREEVVYSLEAVRRKASEKNESEGQLRLTELSKILTIIADALQCRPTSHGSRTPPKKKGQDTAKLRGLLKPGGNRSNGRAHITRGILSKPAKSPDDDSNDLEPTLVVQENPKEHLPEEPLKTLYLHGHRLRLNRLLAARSQEAASRLECRMALNLLLNAKIHSQAEAAAKIIWILTAFTGRHFDKIAATLTKSTTDHRDGDILDIVRDGLTFRLILKHPLSSSLPRIPPGLITEPPRHEFTLEFAIPPLAEIETGWSFLNACSNDEKIGELVAAKEKLRRYVRHNSVDRFTETRIRGAIVQEHFIQNYDFAQVQLVYNEMLDVSSACLHYLSWRECDLQKAHLNALGTLYGTQLISGVAPSLSSRRIGADLASVPLSTIQPLCDHFCYQIRALERVKAKKWWQERHNLFAEACSHILAIGSAHRNTYDLEKIRITDISLTVGLIIYRDKPSDSSVYRRLAVLPSLALSLLKRYIVHLETIVSDRNPHAAPEFWSTAKDALEGKGDLLFQYENGQCRPINTRERWATLLPKGISPNIARHMQSTHLRELGASPLLTEAHLGHQFGGVIYSNAGTISPKELANHILPYLDRFLEIVGYPKPESSSPPPSHRIYSSNRLAALSSEERANDRRQLRSQLRGAIAALPKSTHISNRISAAIATVVPNYTLRRPPRNVVLDKAQATDIRNSLIETYSNDFLAIYRGCRRLTKRLKTLQKEHDWDIQLPPSIAWDIRPPITITRANMVAADQLEYLRGALVKYCKNCKNIDHYTVARCALLLWGNCPSWSDSKKWLEAAMEARTRKGDDFALLDLPEPTGSRTLSGIGLIFTAAWLKAGGPKTQANLARIFGEKVSVSTIEDTVRLARDVLYPAVFAQLINERLPHTELTAKRILDFRDNRTGCMGDLADSGTTDTADTFRGSRRPKKDIDLLFRELRTRLTPANEKVTKPAVAKKRIERWRLPEGTPDLIIALRDWALVLLGSSANRRTQKSLRVTTVSSYLKDVWRPLRKAYPQGDIFYSDVDEASELIEESLSDSDEIRHEEILRLSRFFDEMGDKLPLPHVYLAGGQGPPGRMHTPNIITDKELCLAQRTLDSWEAANQIKASMGPPLAQAKKSLRTFSLTGMRRHELLDMLNKDIISDGKTGVIVLRPNPQRGLKTRSSERYLSHTIDADTQKRPSQHRTEQVYDALENLPSRAAALSAASSAIRFATGSSQSRLHDFRHTVATKGVFNAIMDRCILRRLGALATLIAELGHAHLRTTLYYYAHACHHAISLHEADDANSIGNKVLISLFSESQALIRQRRSRSKRGNSLPAQYAKFFSRQPRTLHQPQYALPSPPALITTEPEKGLRFADVAVWLLRFARGATSVESATGLGLSVDTVKSLLNRLRNLQINAGWTAIEPAVIESEYQWLSNPSGPMQYQRRHHKRFPPGWIDDVIRLGSLPPNSNDLAEFCLSVTWQGRSAPYISLTQSNHRTAEALLARAKLPIRLTQDRDQPTIWRLQPDTNQTKKHDGNLVRLILLSALLSADFARNQVRD